MASSSKPKRSRFRRLVFRMVGLSLGIVVSVVLIESLFSAYAYWKFGTVSVEELLKRETGNAYMANIAAEEGSYLSVLRPHPYLSIVFNEKIEGGLAPKVVERFNNISLLGRDVPLEKDDSKFVILLTGGSVAQQLGLSGEKQRTYLETFFNDQYDFGKEVVVLNCANGGWKQPQQAITFLLYGEVADAVVSLEGFNERYSLLGNALRLEMPDNNFHLMNPMIEHGYETLAAAWQTNELKRYAREQNWRSIYFATKLLRNRIEASVSPDPSSTEGKLVVNKMYELPARWSVEKRIQYNYSQYKKYLRMMSVMADELSVKQAYFIQPCPAINKTLTDEERQVVGDLSYGESYQKMTDELMSFREDGLPMFSLLDVFADVEEQVYEDQIHCAMVRDDSVYVGEPPYHNPSPAYRKMAEAIAAQLAKEWDIPERKTE